MVIGCSRRAIGREDTRVADRVTSRDLPLAGLKYLERNPVGDARGSLQRLYCADFLRSIGVAKPLAQINLTQTQRRGTVRGMHFQHPPHMEIKIVSCLRGKVFDVALDLRQGSPTFLAWHGEVLTPELRNALLIPEGFAHGFQTLSDDCELLYFHTANYCPEAEGGVRADDPGAGIAWPLEVADISDRDAGFPLLTVDFRGIQA
jgi:dTDP-4-dehydrorhamnose 3,5-epimerase